MSILAHRRAIHAAAITLFVAAIFLAPAAAVEQNGPLLTPAQWAKILKRMDQSGDTRVLPFKVADHLGLTKGTQVMTVRELAFEREGNQHGIYRNIDPKDARIVLAFRTPDKHWTAFLTDPHFKLVSAIVWNAGEDPVPWRIEEAQPAFNNELAYWSVIADLF
jgi:hypothetical protein